jgi:hypothetical protein
MKKYLIIAMVAALGACSDNNTGDTSGGDTNSGDNVNPGETTETEGLTFYKDVQPILNTYCTRCHQEGGQGVGDFTTPDDVLVLSSMIMTQLDAGTMPPPSSDPDCRDYVGSDRLVMAPGTKETIRDWIAEGKAVGTAPAQSVEPPLPMELANPDLQIMMTAPYVPLFEDASNPGNEYRCFALDHQQEEDFFITAFHPILGNPEIIHHIVLYRLSERDLPDHDPALGWDCIDDMGGQGEGMIAAWAPGALPVEFDGTKGIKVGSDERLVVQMHYFHNGSATGTLSDDSGYALRITDTVETELRMWPFGDRGFTIPAGDDNYSHDYEFAIPALLGNIDPDATLTVYATGPHMHVLGQSYQLWVERAGEEDICVAKSERWDFDNQVSYVFNEPLVLYPGDKVRLRCSWNNSDSNPDLIHNPPIDVGYGERTDEEMCFAFTLLSLDTSVPIDF